MPPSLYNKYTGGKYINKEDMLTNRKKKDNEKNKVRYWRTKYGYDLKYSDYDEFNKNAYLIKHIYDIHDFFINWNPNDEIKKENLAIYIIKHNHIKNAYPIQDYIKTLKKINIEENVIEKPEKYIIEFE
tara:strand:+ start:32 stop:418 length:387 start_codon:yes stop_codon:yes gene_type:complete